MINKIFKKEIFFIIFFLFYFMLSTKAEEIKIIKKINNQIITNIDIKNEYNYLVALNNNLKNLNTNDANKISEDSLIREIIKHSEIIKFISIEDLQNNKLINDIIGNIYKNLNLVDLNDFENYLKEFGISINDVKRKISIV